MYINLIY